MISRVYKTDYRLWISGRFPALPLPCFTNNFNFSDLLSDVLSPFGENARSIRKEFAPIESIFLPFRKDPFSKGKKNSFDRVSFP